MSSVNHPSHYNSGKIEVIEAIEDWKLDYPCGNAVKYIARAGKKDSLKEIEDLEKAAWYLNRKIETLKAAKEGREKIRPNDMNPRRPIFATDASSLNEIAEQLGCAMDALKRCENCKAMYAGDLFNLCPYCNSEKQKDNKFPPKVTVIVCKRCLGSYDGTVYNECPNCTKKDKWHCGHCSTWNQIKFNRECYHCGVPRGQ